MAKAEAERQAAERLKQCGYLKGEYVALKPDVNVWFNAGANQEDPKEKKLSWTLKISLGFEARSNGGEHYSYVHYGNLTELDYPRDLLMSAIDGLCWR